MHAAETLFITSADGPLARNDLRKSLVRIGNRAGVERVVNYLALAHADPEKTHKVASPVDNWML